MGTSARPSSSGSFPGNPSESGLGAVRACLLGSTTPAPPLAVVAPLAGSVTLRRRLAYLSPGIASQLNMVAGMPWFWEERARRYGKT